MTMKELTKDDLLAVAKRDALEIGGVDDWSWYADSLDEYDYVSSGNEVTDAHNWLQALENGGVDNWTWYDESLTGLSEYESYLNGLDDLSTAMSFYEWKELPVPVAEDEETKGDDESSEEEVDTTLKVMTESDKVLYGFIADTFGGERTDDIYAMVKKDGVVLRHNTFPREFKIALKEIQKGVENPLDKAGVKLLVLVIKNGKLKKFLTENYA